MFIGTVESIERETARYNLAVDEAKKEAESYSTDYLRGYIDSYELGRGNLMRRIIFLSIVSEPAKITGFRETLANRLK